MLPGFDGLSLLGSARSKDIDSILIMLTAKDEETDILECFEVGLTITSPNHFRHANFKQELRSFETL